AFGNLERALGRLLAKPGDASGMDRAQAVLRELVMGVRPDPGTDLPGAIRDLAEGKLDRAAFLRDFGHRGNQEMELSRPRWFEEFADRESRIEDRGSRIEDRGLNSEEVWKKIAAEGKLTAGQRAALEAELQTLHTYLGLRESAKHYLMQGYALIRRYLVE